MSYLVLARKWRPKRFAEMVGQGHVLQALTNALDQSRLHHAYLFTGTRGVGKTTVARIFAKALNCETGVTSAPCGVCAACREIDEGRFVDLIEVDAASRTGVDDTRELLDNVNYAPVRGRFKVYLIDEVHMFSKSSFNALLKTLEEPPPHVKFLLATTDPQKLPVTVLSRCLQFSLRPLPVAQIQHHLTHVLTEENIPHEPAALRLVAEAASGSMRDALSLLDQAIAYTGGRLGTPQVAEILGLGQRDQVWAVLAALAAEDALGVMSAASAALDAAVEPPTFLTQLIEAIHQLAMRQWLPEVSPDEASIAPPAALLAVDAATLQLWYQIATLGRRDMAYAPNARLGLEMVLLRLLAFAPSHLAASSTPAPVSPAPPRAAAAPSVSPGAPSATPPPVTANPSAVRSTTEPASAATASPRPPLGESKALPPESDAPLPPWYALVEHIRPPARALADHCRMELRGQKIILHLAAEYEAVASKTMREKLIEQLTPLIGTRPVEWVIAAPDRVTAAPTASAAPSPSPHAPEQTPAERRAEAEAAAAIERRDAMRQHPVVQVLQDAGGTLLEDTIQPRRVRPDAPTTHEA
ncbi:DNA polymerase III subunit gamma/tau [Halothiobacillus sp. DCM-1]|uniref:DNA polymerase III subunit gamma/tau n=1 Tax=Halothiobacillus sp. DCM-1 TaxID=3112558 RepID=UPI00324A8BAC